MQLDTQRARQVAGLLDIVIITISFVVLLSWMFGNGLFYKHAAPVVSPFTAFSLLLMSGSRFAERTIDTFAQRSDVPGR